MGQEWITEDLKKQMKPLLERLKRQVVLKAVVDHAEQAGEELEAFLQGIASVSGWIVLELTEAGTDEKLEKELCGTHLPVVGIYDEAGRYSGVCFHGVPGGKEINSLIAAICNFGGAGTGLEQQLEKEIEKIDTPKDIKIFVSLACHHCPHVVAACQKIAIANPYVTAQMYDARLYPDLIEAYKIERVPMTVINDKTVIMGQKTIEEFVKYLQK